MHICLVLFIIIIIINYLLICYYLLLLLLLLLLNPTKPNLQPNLLKPTQSLTQNLIGLQSPLNPETLNRLNLAQTNP